MTRFSLDRPRLTLFVMIALIVMGAALYADFPKREEPEITIRTAVVTVQYLGLSPPRLERLIVEPVERKIRQIPQVEDIDTLMVAGRATIKVTVLDRVTKLEGVWQELRDKMEEVARELPAETSGPFVNTDFGDVTIASIAMTAEGFSFAEMEGTAEELQRQLYALDGVGKVRLYGNQEERIWLEFDAKRLASIGVQLPVLIEDLRNQNIILPAGQLNADGTAFLLEASGDFESIEQVEGLLSQASGGDSYIRLADIVTVRSGFIDPPETLVFANGRSAIVIGVEMQSGFDILSVGDAIAELMNQFEREQPIGYAFSLATFQPNEVKRSVTNALTNVVETFVVVLLVVMAFLGIRTGLVIASIVPFAILFALVGMNTLNLALEQVSIAAVIISLGLLVDNGVVVVEDVLSRVSEGNAGSDAALAAGKQFAQPLAVSSGTTIFAFLPFFLLEGPEGEYAFSLGAVVALTLVGSWFSAMYLLPLIAARFVSPGKRLEDSNSHEDLVKWTSAYRKLLMRILPGSKWVICIVLTLVTLGAVLFSFIPAQLFPSSDRGEVLVYMDLPKAAHISETERIALAVGDWFGDEQENPEVINQVTYIGGGGPRFYLALDPAEASPASAFLLVNTADREAAIRVVERARSHLFTHFPEGRFRIKRLAMGAKESGTVEVEIAGLDLERLYTLGREVEGFFRNTPLLVENQHDWGEKTVKVFIDVDQNKARRLGVTSQSLARVLGAYFDGYDVSNFRAGDEMVPIVLRATQEDRDSIADLASISVLTNDGRIAPLNQVADMRPQLEFSQTRRKNQRRIITVTAKSDAYSAAELLDQVSDELNTLDLAGGYEVTIGGELADSSEIYGRLAWGLPAAFTLMLLLIIYQFDSFRRALIVFMTVPLILIGAPIGLLLSGQPLSFMGILGLISLAGIIINNGIVLINQIDIERGKGDLVDSIANAAQKRIRPILLTSITTVLGLFPLYLFGGPLWEPLAVVIIGGLSIASILTLILIPAAYFLLQPPLRGSDESISG